MGKLNDKQKKIDITWQKNVKKGIVLVKDFSKLRLELASLAIETCDICHGGSAFGGKYTLRQFAKDVGINPSTLSEWVSLKRNIIDKVDDKHKHKPHDFFRQIRKRTNKNTSRAEVNRIANDLEERGEVFHKFEKYIGHIKSIKYNCDRDILLSGADIEQLQELQYICRSISASIEDYTNKNYSKNKFKNQSWFKALSEKEQIKYKG